MTDILLNTAIQEEITQTLLRPKIMHHGQEIILHTSSHDGYPSRGYSNGGGCSWMVTIPIILRVPVTHAVQPTHKDHVRLMEEAI